MSFGLVSLLLQGVEDYGLGRTQCLIVDIVWLWALTKVLQFSHKLRVCFISMVSCLKFLSLLYSMCVQDPWSENFRHARFPPCLRNSCWVILALSTCENLSFFLSMVNSLTSVYKHGTAAMLWLEYFNCHVIDLL